MKSRKCTMKIFVTLFLIKMFIYIMKKNLEDFIIL